MTRATLIAGCTALALSASVATAGAATTIRWKNGKVTQIGDLSLARTPTIKRASDAFGAPAKQRLEGKVLCVVDWTALALRGNFVNLGGERPGQTTCTSNLGKLQSAEIRGRALQTQNGLRVGDTLARLRRLHPAARKRAGSWWLASAPDRFSGRPGARQAIVRANVRDGRVAALVLWIGAAGE